MRKKVENRHEGECSETNAVLDKNGSLFFETKAKEEPVVSIRAGYIGIL